MVPGQQWSRTRTVLALMLAAVVWSPACHHGEDHEHQTDGPFSGSLDDLVGELPATEPTVGLGSTPGGFEVTSAGAASYVVPLELPPGRRGVQPQLSLRYRSGSGNGLVGVGWSLQGLSMITRGQAPYRGDVAPRAIAFDDADALLLVAVQGEAGMDGTEYRTEQDTLVKLVSHGRLGDGPESFTAYAPNGTILTYGATAASRVDGRGAVMSWHLDRVEDRHGNYNTVDYHRDLGLAPGLTEREAQDLLPLSIRYTGHTSGLPPTRRVAFDYEPRPDVMRGYLSGLPRHRSLRLREVAVTLGDGHPVRRYALDYESTGSTGRSRLVAITESGADGVALQPTRFAWSRPRPGGPGGPAEGVSARQEAVGQ